MDFKATERNVYNGWKGDILPGMSTTGWFYNIQYFNLYSNFQAPSARFYHLDEHNKTAKHVANAQRLFSKKQQFLNVGTEVIDPFAADLCAALIGANIPIKKANHPKLKGFLLKYCSRNIPDESNLRKKYLPLCYKEVRCLFLTK